MSNIFQFRLCDGTFFFFFYFSECVQLNFILSFWNVLDNFILNFMFWSRMFCRFLKTLNFIKHREMESYLMRPVLLGIVSRFQKSLFLFLGLSLVLWSLLPPPLYSACPPPPACSLCPACWISALAVTCVSHMVWVFHSLCKEVVGGWALRHLPVPSFTHTPSTQGRVLKQAGHVLFCPRGHSWEQSRDF